MTGPEHYLKAEALLGADTAWDLEDDVRRLARAQVHATLALAAATALPASVRYYGSESRADRAWTQVIE